MLLLMSCLFALAAATVATVPASAENCKEKAGAAAICREINTTELELVATGTWLVLQEEGTTHAFKILTATNIIVTCLTAEGTFTTEATLIMKENLAFTECIVESPASCVLGSETITSKEGEGVSTLALVLEPGGSEEVTRLDTLFSPEEEEGTFATFTLKSKTGETCPLAVENGKVKGAILCFWLESIEKDEVEHLNECTAAGSESGGLKFAGKAADLEAEFSVLMLTANGVSHEGSAWGAFLNTE
jgi:hypothetical protein